jgi:hypothetical protein
LLVVLAAAVAPDAKSQANPAAIKRDRTPDHIHVMIAALPGAVNRPAVMLAGRRVPSGD